MKIVGYSHSVRMSSKRSHFSAINLLGSDYLAQFNIALGHNGCWVLFSAGVQS